VKLELEYRRDGWWAFAYVDWMRKLFCDAGPVELGPFESLQEAQCAAELFRRDIANLPRQHRCIDWYRHTRQDLEHAARHGRRQAHISGS
jgi:hypothetical protein